jgi:hypothetical protein
MIQFGRNRKSYYKKITYKKNGSFNWKKRILLSASLALSVFVFWAIFLSPWMIVKNIEVKNNKTIDGNKVVELVQKKIAGNYFYFIPKAKIFLIKPGDLSSALKQTFPILLQTNIRRIFPDKISLNIVERTPAGIWCKRSAGASAYISGYEGLKTRLAESQNYSAISCYDYDANGVIFQTAPYTSGSLITKIYDHGKRFVNSEIGDKVLDSNILDFLRSAQDKLNNEFKLKTEQVILGTDSEGVVFYFASDWFLVLNQKIDLNYQLQVLKNILDQSIGSQAPNLAYIDLRIQNRAYYKYK